MVNCLVGLWSREDAVGSLVDSQTGEWTGRFSSNEWYLFKEDGTFTHGIIGFGTLLNGAAIESGKYMVKKDSIQFDNCSANWYPAPGYPNSPSNSHLKNTPSNLGEATYNFGGQDTLVIQSGVCPVVYLYRQELNQKSKRNENNLVTPAQKRKDIFNNKLNLLMEQLASGGKSPKEALYLICQAFDDPNEFNMALKALNEGMQSSLENSDYYRDGPEKYSLKWPVIGWFKVEFDQVDRRFQYSLLWSEWFRRKLEGDLADSTGKLDVATVIFEECLGRAQQLEAAELVASSYEGLMSIASKRGDLKSEKKWLNKALKVRSNPK